MSEYLGFGILIVVVAFLAGIGIGGGFRDGETVKDINASGIVRIADQAYRCEPIRSGQ